MSPDRTDQDEQTFLHRCGAQLSQLLAAAPVSGAEERSRQARSIVRDLLGTRQVDANPIGDVLDQLISEQLTPGSAEVRLAAISQQLQLTDNAQVSQWVVSFARGFLQLAPDSTADDFRQPEGGCGAEPAPSLAPAAVRPAAAVPPSAAPAAPLGPVMVNQWLMVLTVLAGLGAITVVAIRALNRPEPITQAGASAAPMSGSASAPPAACPAARPPEQAVRPAPRFRVLNLS